MQMVKDFNFGRDESSDVQKAKQTFVENHKKIKQDIKQRKEVKDLEKAINIDWERHQNRLRLMDLQQDTQLKRMQDRQRKAAYASILLNQHN